MVERGTLPGQRTVTAPLAEIAERVAEAGLERAGDHRDRPGRRAARDARLARARGRCTASAVAVTRARAQASGLAARLRELGAEVVETPAIRIEPRPVEGEIVTPSTRSATRLLAGLLHQPQRRARCFFDALATRGLDARALAGVDVAAIGPGTARELARQGIRADVVPPRSVAESLVEALADVAVEGRRVLVARAAEARDVLPDALRERGAEVDVAGPLRHRRRAASRGAARGAGERATT